MTLIKKSCELDLAGSIKMMLYGQAGFGKTTLALSAPKPLLLDFDNGAKRVNLTHLDGVDIVQVTSWKDVQEVLREDLSAYQSIVVDTVGKMMDFIISYKTNGRQPSIRDWGGINAEFQWFSRELSNLNKHCIYIAHRDSRREGDTTVFIPALREKNYNQIVTDLDLLGYMEMRNVNGKPVRTITFDPTDRNDGKNTCLLPAVMNVPQILDSKGNATAPNNFIAEEIIKPYHASLAKKQEAAKEYSALMGEIREQIALITDAKSANDFAARVNDFNHVGNSLQLTRSLFSAKVKGLGLTFNKETKLFEDVAA